jgi:hypothetical protein
MKRLPTTTKEDGEELAGLINQVIEISSRTLIADLYLHYRDGSGWRARIGGSSAADWVSADGPWTETVVAALEDELRPIRAQLAKNDRRAAPPRKSRASRRRGR